MNQSYTTFKSGLLTGVFDLDTAVIKVALVSGYTFSAGHATMADVTAAGGVVNGTATLTGVSVVNGVLDADDVNITTTASSNPHVLIAYQASAVTGGADVPAGQQRLMYFWDTGTNLPIVPGAGTLAVTWPNTAGKIYKVGA